MPEKTENMWVKIFTDYRVIILIIALLLSVIFLAPSYSNGQFNTNLKFGLDFMGGSYVDLKLVNSSNPDQPISDETLELTKSIMTVKLNQFGLANIPLNTVRDTDGNAYILIKFAGIPYDQAMNIVGHQGRFEMRMQTTGNDSVLILDGTDVLGVSPPSYDPRRTTSNNEKVWEVSFTFTKAGAEKFRDISIKYGATTDPQNHKIKMLLDGEEFYSAPMTSELAQNVAQGLQDQLNAQTGAGAEGQAAAEKVSVRMQGGSLPVSVVPISYGQVPAEQGAMFKTEVIIAMILAQCAIGAIMYFRYREPRIILPMFLTSIFEVVIMLGAAVSILPLIFGAQWEIDLPSVAGIIAVIGTGVDQLIIITDEVMATGKAPTIKKVLQKLSSAFKIIVSSAATVIVAMLPLLYMGFGALRGFAIITILGVLIGILITRPAYGRIIGDILGK